MEGEICMGPDVCTDEDPSKLISKEISPKRDTNGAV